MSKKYSLSNQTSKTKTMTLPLFPLLFLPILTSSAQTTSNSDLTHLHFYFRDYVTGPNPTAIRVAQGSTTNLSPSTFGALVMIDDPLTEGVDIGSKIVGRAQGMYGFADQEETGLLMMMNLVFIEGGYNGSSLSVLGRNEVMSNVRELSVVGGSGVFRFATGFAQAKTITLLDTYGATLVEYNVYVHH